MRAKLAGQEMIPAPAGYQLFTPIIDTFLKEHLFADIFARFAWMILLPMLAWALLHFTIIFGPDRLKPITIPKTSALA